MQPRSVLPGQTLLITRRTTQRTMLLRPDPPTNETVLYALALAAKRTGVQVILPCVEANHHHTAAYDRHGRAPEFTHYFHGLTARAMNSLRGRVENFWASEQTNVVRLLDLEAIIDKIVYAATNPVKDGLVARVRHWPGVNGLRALLKRRTIIVKRPRHFFRDDGDLPEEIELELGLPPELGDPEPILAEIERRVAAFEARMDAERAKTGARVMGRRAVLRQSWQHRPGTRAPRSGLRPTLAGRDRAARREALRQDRAFRAAYFDARVCWQAGEPAVFPAGTYWLRRFANVDVAPFARGAPAFA